MTDKEAVWLEEYLKCWNASEAARRAGYKWPNKQGPRKLAKFSDEIAERIEEKAMLADEVLAHLADVARFDLGMILDKTGTINLRRAREKGHTAQLHKIKSEVDKIEVEAYDKLAALEKLGKHLGLWADGGSLEVDGSIAVRFISNVDDDKL